MKHAGVTLVELMMSLAVLMVVAVLPQQMSSRLLEDSRQAKLCARFVGDFNQAALFAASSGDRVTIRFDDNSRPYGLYLNGRPQPLALGPETADLGWGLGLLGDRSLVHPTTGRTIRHALVSSGGSRLVFSPRGSDSGTILFSNGRDRAVCVVVSGASGRIKVFQLQPGQIGWRPYD